jgi:2-polyprenyl-6-hydroxyphenyl methylase/3-demethylubiquinone-9 3-methyltransferase
MESATATDERFEFGANWTQFAKQVGAERIARARESLEQMLGAGTLEGRRMLDIGCGSGLFSLAARQLGATVHSFDYDDKSVGCSMAIKEQFAAGDKGWTIERGDVLDASFMQRLGSFDIVYSWGVLHHTGDMWRALGHACDSVASGGKLFIAIYNDQGVRSRWWWHVKRVYNRLPRPARVLYIGFFTVLFELGAIGVAIARGNPQVLMSRWTRYEGVRGMSRHRDLIDWIGGFPFEVATPDAVFDFCRGKGLSLARLVTCGGRLGCNEFVFVRPAAPAGSAGC